MAAEKMEIKRDDGTMNSMVRDIILVNVSVLFLFEKAIIPIFIKKNRKIDTIKKGK
jgi:hypothetical protein